MYSKPTIPMTITTGEAVNLAHVLAIAPFLGYVGYMGVMSPEWAFTVLMVLAVIVAAYHGARLYKSNQSKSHKSA